MNEVIAEFQRLLIAEIHERVRTYPTEKRVYCVAINYGDDPLSSCIPTIGLGETTDGDDHIPRPGSGGDDEAWWNPAEFSSFGTSSLQPKSPPVLDRDATLRRLVTEGEGIDLREISIRVASELNRVDWHPLPVTPRFTVFAVDDDLVDLIENFLRIGGKQLGGGVTH
jgi:hypothetical protein